MAMIAGMPTGTFEVVAQESDVYVTLRPAKTVLSGLSHEHVIVADRLEGTVQVEDGTCRIDVSTQVLDLKVDPPEKRKALGFDKDLSEGDRKSVAKNMRAKNQLFADRFPSIRFVATDCKAVDEGRIFVHGTLTIRGMGAQVYLPMRVEEDDEGLRARVDFTQSHADFGFSPYSAALGALKNDDALRFHVDVRARRVSKARADE